MENPALKQRFVISAREILKAKAEGAEFLEIPAPIPEALGALVCAELIKIAQPLPLRIDCGNNSGLFLTLSQMGAEYLRHQGVEFPDSEPKPFAQALTLHRQGRLGDASALYFEILQKGESFPELYLNLGAALHGLGKIEEAEIIYQKALEEFPGNSGLANNLGAILKDRARFKEAAHYFEQAYLQNPDFSDALFNLVSVLKDDGLYNNALALWPELYEKHPDKAAVYNLEGIIFRQKGEMQKAGQAFAKASELAPCSPEYLSNWGAALHSLGEIKAASDKFHRAIALDSAYALAHVNLGISVLLEGDYERGFKEFSWRFACYADFKFKAPRWQGEDIKGKSIILWAEHGLGDNLQFVRYIPALVAQGADVTLLCQPRLVAFLSQLPAKVQGWDQKHPVGDYEFPLMDLPLFFPAIPLPPYLVADEVLVKEWRKKLGSGFKIGLNWQGNPGYLMDKERSPGFKVIEPLLNIQGPRFFSLQKGDDPSGNIVNLGPEIDNEAAFTDSAAVLMNLDLFITSDTAIAHLAGALGVKTWLMLPHVPDWRWGLGGENTLWYPNTRLFRQKSPGDWPSVIADIDNLLNKSKT